LALLKKGTGWITPLIDVRAADEKLTAFIELESTIRAVAAEIQTERKT
jgi:hypothetical protein